mgnify:CR=1 FL=1
MKHLPQPQHTDDDLVLLSSYLDRQLTPAEQQAVEERLQVDRALQAELDELRITTALLRDMQPVVSPRSFTLDPAQVRPRRPLLVGWMRLGSLLAALVLALTVTTVYSLLGQPVATVFEAMPQDELVLPEVGQSEPQSRLAPLQSAPPSVADSVPPVDTIPDTADMLIAPTDGAAVPDDSGSAALALPVAPPDQHGLESQPEAASAAEAETITSDAEPEPPPGARWVLVVVGMLGILGLGIITWFIVRPYRR